MVFTDITFHHSSHDGGKIMTHVGTSLFSKPCAWIGGFILNTLFFSFFFFVSHFHFMWLISY
jgi:hypothetical protein